LAVLYKCCSQGVVGHADDPAVADPGDQLLDGLVLWLGASGTDSSKNDEFRDIFYVFRKLTPAGYLNPAPLRVTMTPPAALRRVEASEPRN
jgi:hypothetical protein